ncbi:hypothetical protein Bca101_013368 [Brassica carinata]
MSNLTCFLDVCEWSGRRAYLQLSIVFDCFLGKKSKNIKGKQSDIVLGGDDQFQKRGPKGFIQVKVLENDNLYVRVDLLGVPDDGVNHRVDAFRQKVVFFSAVTFNDGYEKEGVREYSGTAGLGCDCCEITGVDMFVYFSHSLVTIPTPCWTNTAHRHGVKVLGTFITEWDEGKATCNEMLATKESASDVCRAFG